MRNEGGDEILTEFYGIDPVTRKIDSVAISRSGRISQWTDRKGYIVSQMTGNDARSEVTRILGLIELVEVHPRTSNDKRIKILLDLHASSLETKRPT
jgi:hypothetical protein